MRWPQGGGKIPTLNLYKDRRGASRKFLRNSQGGIPPKRGVDDNTDDLPAVICQTIQKNAQVFACYQLNVCHSASITVLAALTFFMLCV